MMMIIMSNDVNSEHTLQSHHGIQINGEEERKRQSVHSQEINGISCMCLANLFDLFPV